MRVILRYSKYGMVRFVSAKDTVKSIERNLRRAKIKMNFSRGFHPHPIMSFLDSTPVGVVNRALYFSIEVEKWDDEDFKALKEVAARGLEPVSFWVVDADINSLVDGYSYSLYLEEKAVDISRISKDSVIKKGKKGKELKLFDVVDDWNVLHLKSFIVVKYTLRKERIFSPWEIVKLVRTADGVFLPILEEALVSGRSLGEVLEGMERGEAGDARR